MPIKNLPLLMNTAYYGFNRGLTGDFVPTIENGVFVTHCNQFIQFICNAFGYINFNGLTANEMIAYMDDYRNGWITQDDATAQQRANEGIIVIAGHKSDGHGHVCLIVPGILERSSAYGKPVPKCVNVGKDVFFGKRVSFAFRQEEMPTYYALAGMI